MASFSDLPLKWRTLARVYPWRRIDPVPWTPMRKPLAKCRVALVSSAGFVPPGEPVFDASKLGGDPSFRVIPGDIDVRTLRDAHRSGAFDHTGMVQDPNLAFPLDRLRELAADGRIGEVNGRHLSFMGSLSATGHLVRRSAPDAARLLAADRVDAVLLVPV